MRTRTLVALPLALLAVLALSAAAFAGGWAAVTMADPPSDITPGEETTVEMTVLQHNQTPVDWPKITVVATNADTGAIVRAKASAVSGHLGQYQATLTFPTDGRWAITYESPDLVMDGTATLAVAAAPPVPAAPAAPPAAPAAEPATAPTAPAAVASPDNLLIPFALAVTGILLVGLFAALLMRRHAQPIEHKEQPIPSRG